MQHSNTNMADWALWNMGMTIPPSGKGYEIKEKFLYETRTTQWAVTCYVLKEYKNSSYFLHAKFLFITLHFLYLSTTTTVPAHVTWKQHRLTCLRSKGWTLHTPEEPLELRLRKMHDNKWYVHWKTYCTWYIYSNNYSYQYRRCITQPIGTKPTRRACASPMRLPVKSKTANKYTSQDLVYVICYKKSYPILHLRH